MDFPSLKFPKPVPEKDSVAPLTWMPRLSTLAPKKGTEKESVAPPRMDACFANAPVYKDNL